MTQNRSWIKNIQFFPCGGRAPLLKHLNCQEQNGKNKHGYFKSLIRVKIAVISNEKNYRVFLKSYYKGKKIISKIYVAAPEYA